jgi:hypothetical protein
MKKLGISAAVAIGGALVAMSAPALSQTKPMPLPEAVAEPESTIYRDANFSGPAVAIRDSNPNLGLAWPVNSIRVKAGRWQLCERTNYRGTCRTYDTDTSVIRNGVFGHPVQSIRLLGWTGGGVPGNNQSLRGMAAEFYPAPARNGSRELACTRGTATITCAAQTADRFCVAMNYRGSARQAMETVYGRVYLADVLCTRTGY